MPLSSPKLDPKEEHFRIASNIDGLTLFLRYLPPNTRQAGASKIVLYVHGGSFPSALSIAHRFDGRSWRDDLTEAGFHKLLLIALANSAIGSFFGTRQRRQKQRRQNGNDGNDHQQFNQCECPSGFHFDKLPPRVS